MREVFRVRGVPALFLASCVARLPMGAFGLLLVLHTREMSGSYASSGIAAGAYAIAYGFSSPVLARLIDRRGQTVVLQAGCVLSAVAMFGLAALPDAAPTAAIAALGAAAGAAQPPVGACMRALWPELLSGDRLRQQAYAMESIVLEVVYICGPVALVAGIGAWSLRAAIAACGVFVLAGDLAFSLRRASRAWLPHPERVPGFAGALGNPAVRLLATVFVLAGSTVGAVEVAVPAGLEDAGAKGAVGLVLAAWGAGSMLGGFAVARIGPAAEPHRRLVVLLLAWSLAHALVAVARTPLAYAALLLLAGMTIAPTFVCVNGLLDRVVAPGTLTEAFTWTSTGMSAGLAIGSAVAGLLVTSASPAAALAVTGIGAALGALLTLGAGAAALRPAQAISR